MQLRKYIYNINFQDYEEDLCALEMRALFNRVPENKVFSSDTEVEPSVSPFIKNRLEVIYETTDFDDIIKWIIRDEFAAQDFMVKYIALNKGGPKTKECKRLSKAIGLVVNGVSSFKQPKVTLGVSCYEDRWVFGRLVANNSKWKAHIDKPHAYSSAIGINIAKVLISIAGSGDQAKKLIDPCCGVGTVLLEGKFAGYDIKGSEINDKVAENARRNLTYFGYAPDVITGDIRAIDEHYDASIIDLPYGNFSHSNAGNQQDIIRAAKRISGRVVLVSSEDIAHQLTEERLTVIDSCKVRKRKNSKFVRYIWVCVPTVHTIVSQNNHKRM